MGLFDHFPYTNVHELNLDWILRMMKALEAAWEAFTAGNSLQFADPMLHDVTKTYAKNTIVLDGNGNAYVSLQAVPVGVGLQNGDYWLMVFDYEAFIEKVNKNFTANYYRGSYRATAAMAIGDWLTVDDVLYKATAAIAVDDVLEDGVNITHFTLEDFIKAFMQSANQLIQQYKNDIDASELLYRQQLAQDIANTTSSLQTQLNQAISGATVDSEVINARVGWNNTVYATLRDAIVTQILHSIHSVEALDATAWANYSNDYNELPADSIFIVNTSSGISNAPTATFIGNIITANYDTVKNGMVQIATTSQNVTYIRIRWSGTWRAWKELAYASQTILTAISLNSAAWANYSNDYDNLDVNRLYQVADSTGISNAPVSGFIGTVLTFNYDTIKNGEVQIATTSQNVLYMRIRWAGSWRAWKHIADIDDIASLAVVPVDHDIDATAWLDYNSSYDDLPINRILRVVDSSGITNAPTDSFIGTVLTFNYDTGVKNGEMQIAITSQNVIYTRIRWAGNWRAWKKLATASDVDSVKNDMIKLSSIRGLNDFIVIGDSITVSQSWLTNNTYVEVKSWASIMADMMGRTATLFAAGGRSTTDFLADASYSTAMADTSQFAILFLGINDVNESTPIGTAASIGTNDGTFIGNYDKILTDLLVNHEFVFCLNIPAILQSNPILPDYNDAIVTAIDNRSHVYLLDIMQHDDLLNPFFQYGHLSSIGYATLAGIVADAIAAYMPTKTFFKGAVDNFYN